MATQHLCGQPQSVLALDPPKQGKSPFHQGDQLEIRGDASAAFIGVTRIIVLDPTNWPWVLVKAEQGEVWLNFNHVVMVKNSAAVK